MNILKARISSSLLMLTLIASGALLASLTLADIAITSSPTTEPGYTGLNGTSPPAVATGKGGATFGTVSVPLVSMLAPAPPPPPCSAMASPSGAVASDKAELTDCQGNVWKLSSGQPLMNQNPAGIITGGTGSLLQYKSELYRSDYDGRWWRWNSDYTGWTPMTADPRSGGIAANVMQSSVNTDESQPPEATSSEPARGGAHDLMQYTK